MNSSYGGGGGLGADNAVSPHSHLGLVYQKVVARFAMWRAASASSVTEVASRQRHTTPSCTTAASGCAQSTLGYTAEHLLHEGRGWAGGCVWRKACGFCTDASYSVVRLEPAVSSTPQASPSQRQVAVTASHSHEQLLAWGMAAED